MEVEVPWAVVYLVISLPACGMFASFIFGSCFLSDIVESASQKTLTRGGRTYIALIGLILLVQLMIFTDFYEEGCSVAAALTDTSSVDCSGFMLLYLASWFAVLLSYVALVTSNPQRGAGPLRYCRRCGVHVPGRDHHCPFAATCVGSGNYALFILFIAAVWANSFLITHAAIVKHVLTAGNAVQVAGFAVTVFFHAAATLLLLFHCLLVNASRTTVDIVTAKSWRSAIAMLRKRE